jgi:hypothetical protein
MGGDDLLGGTVGGKHPDQGHRKDGESREAE